jgi:tripartite ATP-independent transporter DctP family solute receptor
VKQGLFSSIEVKKNKQREDNNMKVFKKLGICLVILTLLLSFMPAMSYVTAEQPIVFKLAFTDAPYMTIGGQQYPHMSYAAMLAFKDSLEKSSNGRIKVELYPNGTLGDANENLQGILSGTIQGGTPADGTLSAFCPKLQLVLIPYLINNPTTSYRVLDGTFGQNLFNDMAQTSGLKVLSVWPNGGFRNFTNNKREIKTASDMKGLKIRVMTSPAYMQLVKALGANPVAINWLELYSALQSGVVDGEENSGPTILGGSLQQVQKYMTIDRHLLGLAFIVTGEKWFESLPKDLQEDVIKAGKDAQMAGRAEAAFLESKAIDTIAQSGVKIYVPTPQEIKTFSDAAQQPVIEWLKNNIDPSLVNEYLAAVAQARVASTTVKLQIGKMNFTVDGQARTLDSPPIIKNSRTLLPLRAIIEALEGTVSWDASEKRVTVTLSSNSGDNVIELWIGKNTAKVNGVDTPIDATNAKVVPEIINGRTMLPLRFISESLGAKVDWNGTTQAITVTWKP